MLELPTPAVDQIGRRWGWKLERSENHDRVAAAVTGGLPVAVYQDAGRRDWWQPFGSWPHHFERIAAWPGQARWRAVLVISDRLLSALPAELAEHTVVYRPPTLALGVGGGPLSCHELEGCVAKLFTAHRLCEASLTALAAGVANKHSAGFAEFADGREIPFLTYAADKLALVSAPGRADACEAAAMLAAGVRELIVPRTLVGGATLAVARRAVSS